MACLKVVAFSAALLMGACAPSPRWGAHAPPAQAELAAPKLLEPVPKLRLPADVHPTGETLFLTIDPTRPTFSGSSDLRVTLDHPRRVIWLHGQGLQVSRATVASAAGGPALSAVWEEHDAKGTASLTLPSVMPAGQVSIHIDYEARFQTKQEGLFTVTQSDTLYAFTQFENIAARQAFPCFDEPGFKIPWDVTLTVPKDDAAIANTSEVSRERDDTDAGRVRVHFGQTKPLPSYLVAFAVGPLDVVKGPDAPASAARVLPVPLRGVATRGRGPEMAYAVAHTGELVSMLERYFGIAYPYEKVDILAIPEMGGAMENAAALTFNDGLLLFEPRTASSRQVHDFAQVMTHELAHQWVGDLVTAAWWDDIWLNEAFATFMEAQADTWDPATDATMTLLRSVHEAMGGDALVHARAIRQPIESVDDIANAFDSITYLKGAGVLRMFERWIGPETFRRGIGEYLREHAFATATADDFLRVMSRVAGRDVAGPFRTFLDQPGVPYIESSVRCDGAPRLYVRQSRYLPAFSKGSPDGTWQVPICVRAGRGKETTESCTLLTSREQDLPLGGACPDWVFPNAGGAGYFRVALDKVTLDKLKSHGYAQLNAAERLAVGDGLQASLGRGDLSLADALQMAELLAHDPRADVAGIAMDMFSAARRSLYGAPGSGRSSIESAARAMYRGTSHTLGWERAHDESAEAARLRVRVLTFLALTGRDPEVRSEARRRARGYFGTKGSVVHPDAVDPDLAPLAFEVLGEDADAALTDELRARLASTEDSDIRGNLVSALAATRRPELTARVRDLIADKTFRPSEALSVLVAQLAEPETQADAWTWMKAHWDALLATTPSDYQSSLVAMPAVFCDGAHRSDVAAFFASRIAHIDGAPRELAETLEAIDLCTARRPGDVKSASDFHFRGTR